MHKSGKAYFVQAMEGLLILFSTISIATAETSGVHVEPQVTLANPEQALARALEYTGFDKAEGYSKASVGDVKLVTGQETKTPFVSAFIKGCQVWSVIFKGIPVKSERHVVDRNFEVILDPVTGRILQIVSVAEDVGSADTLPEPQATIFEDKKRKAGFVFNGLPERLPKVCFYEALDAVSMFNPARSKVIKAIYIDYMMQDSLFSQKWLIIIRGSESPDIVTGPAPEQVLMALRNSLLCAVDAVTGRFEYMTNAPFDPKDVEREWKRRQNK